MVRWTLLYYLVSLVLVTLFLEDAVFAEPSQRGLLAAAGTVGYGDLRKRPPYNAYSGITDHRFWN